MRNERGTNIPLCLVHFSFLFFSPEPNESKGRRSTSAWRRRRQSNGAAQGNTKDVASGDVALARPIISPAITSTSTATSQPERAFPLPPPYAWLSHRCTLRCSNGKEKKKYPVSSLHRTLITVRNSPSSISDVTFEFLGGWPRPAPLDWTCSRYFQLEFHHFHRVFRLVIRWFSGLYVVLLDSNG